MREHASRSSATQSYRVAAIAISGLLALALAGCSDPTAVVPQQQERIVFLGNRDDQSTQSVWYLLDIYIMNVDGTDVENLTHEPITKRDFSLSPDGARIVFEKTNCEIAAMNTDGTDVVRLTEFGSPGGGCSMSPLWSPDGSQVAFLTNREGRSIGTTSGLYDIYVMNADGSDQHNVSHSVASEELGIGIDLVGGWTPDGRVVITTGAHVYLVDADGSDLEPILDVGDESPAFSPDGSMVAFIRQDALYIANADGSGSRALTAPHCCITLTTGSTNPWSPDGTRVVFARGPGEDDGGLYVVDVNGSLTTRLSFVTRDETNFRHTHEFNGWSFDGETVLYTVGTDLFVVGVDGGGMNNLTDSDLVETDGAFVPR